MRKLRPETPAKEATFREVAAVRILANLMEHAMNSHPSHLVPLADAAVDAADAVIVALNAKAGVK